MLYKYFIIIIIIIVIIIIIIIIIVIIIIIIIVIIIIIIIMMYSASIKMSAPLVDKIMAQSHETPDDADVRRLMHAV